MHNQRIAIAAAWMLLPFANGYLELKLARTKGSVVGRERQTQRLAANEETVHDHRKKLETKLKRLASVLAFVRQAFNVI